ncbi:activator of Hsp90 ATPase 1 family protein [Alicyclobacillus acidocaldarius]|uniref:Activator of Hsp90 ATPase 1 family protein n=1 Tax=Alicyclobacillus acidocaldarius (strain Tc-4-1) TaxID=1048834 RepID=F8IIR6_ALIAT|nr:activator of Hsp90 ATPase 1 family protein [Alicyclobacillus acidocaldarius]AEJ44591.1 Activator of Hsp90 ATPase 1 family protein [Alicyclobacillus acidocaldarius subsp. acidocaldarius Tc-4-1]
MAQLPDIVVDVVIDASAEKIWPYVATADGLGAWFMGSTPSFARSWRAAGGAS